MKCNYCGNPLTLEQENCPHCGRVNEEALQHARDMKSYRDRFKDTQKDVYAVVKKNSEITANVVIVMVLVLLCIAVYVIAGCSYSIYRSFKQADATRHAEAYTEQLKQYMEAEDYPAVAEFCTAHYIRSYGSEGYEAYLPAFAMAEYYQYMYLAIIWLTNPQYEDGITHHIEELADYYSQFERQREQLDPEGADREYCSDAIDRMEDKIQVLLRTYFGMSKEEAEGFGARNKAERMMLLMEKYEEMGYADQLEQ